MPHAPLGQHFLASGAAVQAIIDAANLVVGDTVLEIGPGKGVLTEALLETGANVIAIEKDASLTPLLREKFAKELARGQLTLIEADIRDIEEATLPQTPYKLIANIPYYITGFIIRTFLEATQQPTQMVLLVQKEVAERIVTRNTKESLLSLSVKAYGTPRIVRIVPRGSFVPPPAVDSAIVSVETISRAFFKTCDEKTFFATLKKGFAGKRKQLAGKFGTKNRTAIESLLQKQNLPLTARAEDLSLTDWQILSSSL